MRFSMSLFKLDTLQKHSSSRFYCHKNLKPHMSSSFSEIKIFSLCTEKSERISNLKYWNENAVLFLWENNFEHSIRCHLATISITARERICHLQENVKVHNRYTSLKTNEPPAPSRANRQHVHYHHLPYSYILRSVLLRRRRLNRRKHRTITNIYRIIIFQCYPLLTTGKRPTITLFKLTLNFPYLC